MRGQVIRKSRDRTADVPRHSRLSLARPLGVDDLSLAVFPIPLNPLRLKWHDLSKRAPDQNWTTCLSRLGVPATKVFKGEGIDAEERLVLRMFASDIEYDWSHDDNEQAACLLCESP